MDHVVYLDAKAEEMGKLLDGRKSMIIRGADASVFNSDKMDKDESAALVIKHQPKLQLTDKLIKKWTGKRYIILIEIDKSDYGSMDDWLPVGDIENVKKQPLLFIADSIRRIGGRCS